MRASALLLFMVACRSSTSSAPAPPQHEASALRPGETPASAEACEAALARMRQIMPETLDPDPEVDRADCKNLPAALVACLTKIQSRADAEACVDRASPPLTP